MAGLFFLAILSLWILICVLITRFIFKNVKRKYINNIFIPVAFLLILTAPLMDEIIGGFQFRSLCKERSILIVDKENATGRVVVSAGLQKRLVHGYILPITEEYWSYRDRYTGEMVISWFSFSSSGGWLSRSLNLFQYTGPYTFNGSCMPSNFKKSIFSDLNITRS